MKLRTILIPLCMLSMLAIACQGPSSRPGRGLLDDPQFTKGPGGHGDK